MDIHSAGMYLRGFFDGEGSCVLVYHGERSKRNATPTLRKVCCTNTDPAIVAMVERCLTICDISFSRHARTLPSGKVAVQIDIFGRRDLVLFRRRVGFTSLEKAARLKAMLASYKRLGMRAGDRWVLLYPRVREMRIAGMKYREISAALGMPMGSINKALGTLPQDTRAALTERACLRAKCGKPFLPANPERRYCSPACAQLDWEMRKRAEARIDRACARCGAGFSPRAGNQRYCSAACYELDRRKGSAHSSVQ